MEIASDGTKIVLDKRVRSCYYVDTMIRQTSTRTRKPNVKRTTTADIARLTGLSRATVSAVLNRKPGVNLETREKVFDVIRTTGYETGLFSRSLLCQLSRMVIVISPGVDNPFYHQFFEGITRTLEPAGYHVLFHHAWWGDEGAIPLLETIRSYGPAGIIVHGSPEGIPSVVDFGVPCVGIEAPKGLQAHRVYFDVRAAAKLVADHLLSCGHRRIAFLGGPVCDATNHRKVGIIESFVDNGIELTDLIVRYDCDNPVRGYQEAVDLLQAPELRPTAIFCFNDYCAFGVYRAAHQLELHIPRDLSVTGFDGIEVGELLGPPLTTVSIFPRRQGEEAARLLLRAMRGEVGPDPVMVAIEPELVIRESVRNLNAKSDVDTANRSSRPQRSFAVRNRPVLSASARNGVVAKPK
jgi:DNA-binding LacI/PurR family transcriptional regulator